MKAIISAREVQELLRNGGDVKSLPSDAILTPSARDLLREFESNGVHASSATAPGKAVTPSSSRGDLESFFNSPEIHAFKLQICEVGRRLWSRAYVDGNGGNIAVRVGEGIALCTPTLVSKGFMKPEDLCLVDLEGNQLCGQKKRTSEILMHLQIMKRQPRAVATVHCHPPHATAFAVAGIEPPTCMIPEIEVFIGKVPIAPYRTPGTPEMGKLVSDLVGEHNTILMANHGVVSWSHVSVEDAYFKMEIIEAYCRTVAVAAQLGAPLKTFSQTHLQDLLKIKQTLGIPDPRIGLKECELCNNAEWRPGATCSVPPKPMDDGGLDPQAEALVQAITDQIMSKLNT
ncbi:MAG TPA: class II aldolase/adducin family protein [Candidatus Baltobacteraceae bacterium]|jgi:L-fuculose-phosphate aldolase|nr:class II aldolase/adducin family protein [Candidatus Baltobacteraceae bacterium]